MLGWNSFDDVIDFQREVDPFSTSSGAICRPARLLARLLRST